MPRLASGGSPPAKRCVAGPRTRRDVMIAPPLPGRGAHAHYARNIRTRIARSGSPSPAVAHRCGARLGIPRPAVRTKPQNIFVLLSIPLKRSLCSFVFKIPDHRPRASPVPRGALPLRALWSRTARAPRVTQKKRHPNRNAAFASENLRGFPVSATLLNEPCLQPCASRQFQGQGCSEQARSC